jgi:hypothetical protein
MSRAAAEILSPPAERSAGAGGSRNGLKGSEDGMMGTEVPKGLPERQGVK